MASTSTPGMAQHAQSRTLREVVVRSPDLVSEIWCRKVFRQILQTLEQLHALGMPHAPITPDTIGFDRNDDPVLLASGEAQPEPGEATDVQALGAAIHYAITGESPPAAPLRGRAPGGYSDSLVGAVDRCTSADAGARPQTIDELRNLLGIVALGPPVSRTPPVAADTFFDAVEPAGSPLFGRWQRWLLIGLAVLVLLAAASALFALLRGTDARDTIVLSLPEAVDPAGKTLDPNETLVQPTPPAAAVAGAPAGSAIPAPAQAPQPPAAMPDLQSAPGARPAQPSEPVAQPTTYKLLIKPWGTVYVNGIERGVSPPLKRLTLPAGRHTVRIVNPNFRDRVMRIEAGKRQSGRIVHDFAAKSR